MDSRYMNEIQSDTRNENGIIDRVYLDICLRHRKMEITDNDICKYFQGTALQLGLAIENQKATLSVKRRLACEQLTYFTQVDILLVLFVNREI